jgi:phage N-6-adenine-methyltransferase
MTNEKPEWWSSDEWSTPQDVVDVLSGWFGPFDLDPCCRPETAKAPAFFAKGDDGLTQPWHGRVWVNPPYSDPRPWIEKAIQTVESGEARRVVMLLPCSTDTAWFHDLVIPHADIVFMRGRVRFLGWMGTPIGSPKSGTVVAIFPKRATTMVLSQRRKPARTVGAVDPSASRTGTPSTRV